MIAVIVAAGHGECLRPVCGKPLLERQLQCLRAAGVESAVLCLGFGAAEVRAHFGDGSLFGVKLRYSVEEAPLGTAGAVKALGAASLPDDILVICGDVSLDTDLRKMIEFHRSHRALATIAVRPARPDEEDLVVMGPERVIIDFPASASPGQTAMAAARLWIARRALLHFVADGRPVDFMKDVFPAALKAQEVLAGYPEGAR